MALTITRAGYNPRGSARPIRGGFGADIVMTMGQFTFDSTYTTGGVALSAASMGLLDAMFVMLTVQPSAGSSTVGYGVTLGRTEYNYTTGKVMAFQASAGADAGSIYEREMPHGANLSAWTVRFVAFGHKLK